MKTSLYATKETFWLTISCYIDSAIIIFLSQINNTVAINTSVLITTISFIPLESLIRHTHKYIFFHCYTTTTAHHRGLSALYLLSISHADFFVKKTVIDPTPKLLLIVSLGHSWYRLSQTRFSKSRCKMVYWESISGLGCKVFIGNQYLWKKAEGSNNWQKKNLSCDIPASPLMELSEAYTDHEVADSWRLSAGGTPHTWTARRSDSTSTGLPHSSPYSLF